MKIESVSFVVPAYNEESSISKCISSILKECHAARILFEVIVVDPESTDNTRSEICKHSVRYISCENLGPAFVRNYGASVAVNDLICFIDGDCILPSGWLKRLLGSFQHGVGAVGGSHIPPDSDNKLISKWNPQQLNKIKSFSQNFHGCNISVLRDIFEKSCGFNENLISAEDEEFSKRLRSDGVKTLYDTELAVVHLGYPASYWGVFEKQRWHGKTQLKAHGIFGDKITLLTLTWVLLLVISISIYVCSSGLSLVCLSVWAAIPFIVIVNRLKYSRHIKFLTILILYPVAVAFLAGRSIGLASEIYAALRTKKGGAE